MRAYRTAVLLAALLLLIPGLATAVTSYDIAIHGDRADINVTVELYPQEPERSTRLTTSWLLPEGTEVRSVSDSDGEVDWELEGDKVTFDTHISADEGKEVVHIEGSADGLVEEEYRGLDLVNLRLSGFGDRRPEVPEEVTQVRLTTDRPLLSESHSFGFDASLGDRAVNYSGEGPVNLHLAISSQGEYYDNLVLFGSGNLSTADDLYWVPAAVTGFLPRVNRYPVVVYPEELYNEKVDEWSAGQYRTGGVIFIRNSTLHGNEGTAIVLHEVMHGFNEKALRWTSANRAWFDEGTAKYVEWLVNKNMEVRQSEIFGEGMTWTEGRKRYTLPPRKEPEDLLNYYRENQTFMEDWHLFDESTDRRFGYAYSELLVRRYVLDNGPGALRPVYSQLLQLNEELDAPVDDLEASNQRILDIMGTGFQPCHTTSREEMKQCLEEVHSMEGEIPELGDISRDVNRVDIQPVKPPASRNISTGERIVREAVGDRSFTDDLSRLIAELRIFVKNLVQALPF